MLLKSMRIFGMSLAGLALANVATAAEEAGTNVTTGATSAKLGGEFRSEILYNNHGLEKTDDYTPKATTEIQVQAMNVKLHGNFNKDTEFGFRFNLLNPVKGPLDYGYGTHWFNKTMGFSLGKMKVMQGGWDNWEGDYRAHAVGVYFDNMVFDEFAPMAALHLKVAGDLRLQIVNDVSVASKTGEWNNSAHPTWILGWMGEFGPIHPLVDIGSYDNNKSRYIDLGVKTSMNALAASVDVYNNSRAHKGADTDGKAKEVTDTATAITLNVSYEMKGAATPFLYFSTYSNKQADDKDNGSEDMKANEITTDAKTGAVTYNWDDNGNVWAVGSNLNMMGKGWNPYVAIVGKSGKFYKTSPVKAADDDSETKSEMWVRVGVLGEI